MALFLLLLSSIAFGSWAWMLAGQVLAGIGRHQQSQKLKALVTPGGTPLPLKSLLPLFGSWLGRFSEAPVLKGYRELTGSFIRRADRPGLEPSHILVYQCLGGMVAGTLFMALTGSLPFALLALALGAALPVIWLKEKAQEREYRILKDLPDALEVLALCSEAGLSLEQAMEQYLLNGRRGPLATELGAILEQTRTGSGRKQALTVASQKLGLTDFSLFTSSLVHAERFGTGIARTLKQLSRTLRDQQAQRAEKAVQEMPVKLLFPLVLFIMPVTFLIIFGPILLQFLKP